MILKEYLKLGHKWREITKIVPHRIEGAVKNRIKSLIHKIKQNYGSHVDVKQKIEEILSQVNENISFTQESE